MEEIAGVAFVTAAVALAWWLLWTVLALAVEKSSTILFPLPMELLRFFEAQAKKPGPA